jgi:hypothetical protein
MDEVAEVFFELGEWPLELIWFPDVLNNDFVEVEEAMIHGVERPCKLIFYILAIVKTTCTQLFKWYFM